MEYVILDLEWNGSHSAKVGGYINEIIEFGAVKLNEDMEIIGQFSVLVRPDLTKKLRNRIKDLTSLTNEELKKGYPFQYAFSKFRKFAQNCILMTWSTTDIITLMENCLYYLKNDRLQFLKQYVDLQEYCQEMMGLGNASLIGLVPMAEMLGLDVDDIPHHRAIGDSIVSAKCLQKLYSKGALKPHIQKADCNEFYERLLFHNTYASSFENPLVDKSAMTVNCNLCGARSERQTDWELKNRGFYATFLCPKCRNEFEAKIMFRIKYDGVTPIKKLASHSTDDDTENQPSAE